MNKFFSLLIILFLVAPAADAKRKSWGWFDNLLKALTSDTARRYASSGRRVTAVAAVRGAPLGQQDPAELYWKGSLSEQAAKSLTQQRSVFAAAVQLVLDGKPAKGTAALKRFKKKYPRSPLLEDVEETLAKIQESQPKKPKKGKEPPKEAEGTTCADPEAEEESEGCAAAPGLEELAQPSPSSDR